MNKRTLEDIEQGYNPQGKVKENLKEFAVGIALWGAVAVTGYGMWQFAAAYMRQQNAATMAQLRAVQNAAKALQAQQQAMRIKANTLSAAVNKDAAVLDEAKATLDKIEESLQSIPHSTGDAATKGALEASRAR